MPDRQTVAWLLVCIVFGVSGYWHGQQDEFSRGWDAGSDYGFDQAAIGLKGAIRTYGLCEAGALANSLIRKAKSDE